jgi:transposase
LNHTPLPHVNSLSSKLIDGKRKTPREYDRELYKARHLIENFFCKLKHFRGIATRYDKLSRNFLAALQFAAILIWLN